jgi:ArsR family transcriptional regulator, arsenate/arsenite/antimonite-responsive transcriptional repressor
MATAHVQMDDDELARVCKALSNPVRLHIVRYILQHPGCIGNEILLNLPEDCPHAQSTISQHLRVLRTAGLIDAHDDGPAVCYRVNANCLYWLREKLATLAVLSL